MLLLLSAPVLAGGWAEVRPDAAATTQPPREGQPIEIGFTVLQHGETPAGWVTPTVHLMDITSGTTLDVAGRRSRSGWALRGQVHPRRGRLLDLDRVVPGAGL